MNPYFLYGAIAVVLLLALLRRLPRKPRRARGKARRPRLRHREAPSQPYVGDFTGPVALSYAPKLDGAPDPGEIVWTWVPFEEDHTQGKDRPVLLIGRDKRWLLGLQLSTRNHMAPSPPRPRHRQSWVDIGSGPWDRSRRPSRVRVDRIVRIDPAEVRREGAVLDRKRFDMVARSLSKLHH